MKWLLLLSVFAAMPVHAQMAVYDHASLLKLIEQARTAQQQLQKAADTYNQAVTAYNTVHGLTTVNGLSKILDSDIVKQWLPSGAQDIEKLMSSGSSSLGQLGSAARAIRQGRQVNLPALPANATAADQANRAALMANGDTAAKNAAIADAAFKTTTDRSAGLDELQQALAGATEEKDRQAIQARINIEVARIQNASMQLNAVKMRQDAEERLQAQQIIEQDTATRAADYAAKSSPK